MDNGTSEFTKFVKRGFGKSVQMASERFLELRTVSMYDYDEMEALFASLRTCKTLNRFALEDIIKPESIASHSFGVAVMAYIISSWMKENMEELADDIDPNRIVVRALFHDYPEIITGDLNYWVKNHSGEFSEAWLKMEEGRMKDHASFLPAFMSPAIEAAGNGRTPVECYVIKCADYIDFTFKALHEARLGNREGLRLAKVGVEVINSNRRNEYEAPGHPVIDIVAYCIAKIRRLESNAD